MIKDHTTAAIRQRLFLLQLKSFGIVVTICMIVVLIGMTWVVFQSVNISPLDQIPIVASLKGYYLGNQHSWDGVDVLFSEMDTPFEGVPRAPQFWEVSYLVDEYETIIYQSDLNTENKIGKRFKRQINDLTINLVLEGKAIGVLVINAYSIPSRLRVVGTLIVPVGVIVIILAIFLTISNYYIVRRIINPLSGTIAAAKEVAAGNLHARVKVKGPDDLNVLNDTFNTMVASLEETNSARREFLADIAHELRTPLTIMRGRMEGILDGVYDADETHLAPILQETYLLERLVDDLRTLTLAETRQLHFDQKSVDLVELAKSTLEVFQAQADQDGIQLNMNAPQMATHAIVDPQRLEQVLGNIIQNSFKQLKQADKLAW